LARELECASILQLGDFGYWEHTDAGKAYLDHLNRWLHADDLQCLFVDGNHDNHAWLRDRYLRTGRGLAWIRPRIQHANRGSSGTLGGVRFLALGGAYSIDKDNRVEGESWWPEETITDEEVRRCLEVGKADIMLCHDAPFGAEGVIHPSFTAGNKDLWPESTANRKRIRVVMDAAQPRLLFHGHYHHRNSTRVGQTQVEGLSCNGRGGDAYTVLDLDDFNAGQP
jgi:Icc-related predicted phosphoesterase